MRAERGADGVVKVTMRGDLFDGRGFLKSAISGKEGDSKSKTKSTAREVTMVFNVKATWLRKVSRSAGWWSRGS